MMQYVNSYTCAFDEGKKYVVIHFKQNEPIVIEEDSQNKIENVENSVSSIVMDMELAKDLCDVILSKSAE